MANLIDIPAFKDDRGELRVIQRQLPFVVKRVYYIHGKPNVVRGGHRHQNTDQVLVCLHGACTVSCNDGSGFESYVLDNPSKALYVDRDDWHTMQGFTNGAVLLVLASTNYDVNDYIDEPYI